MHRPMHAWRCIGRRQPAVRFGPWTTSTSLNDGPSREDWGPPIGHSRIHQTREGETVREETWSAIPLAGR